MVKKLTLEALAQMIKRGFDQTATKDDFNSLKGDLNSVKNELKLLEQKTDNGFHAVNRRLDLLHEDTSDLPDIRDEIRSHDTRITRLERKMEIRK